MPPQTNTSPLVAKLGQRLLTTAAAHKHEEPDVPGMDLPGGIENGIARLVDCRFLQIKPGKQGAGEWMFYAAGVVLLPAAVGGVPVRGLRTSVTEPLYDTPGRSRPTVEDHVRKVQDYLKLLGADMDSLDGENFEAVAAALKEAKPTFRFRTWKPPKNEPQQTARGWVLGNRGPYRTLEDLKARNPRWAEESNVLHVWGGVVDYAEDEAGGVEDNTPRVPSPPANGTGHAPRVPASPRSAEPEPEEAFDEFAPVAPEADDLDDLVTRAGEEDGDAQQELKARALVAGLTEDEVDGLGTWPEVADAVRAAEGTQPAEDEEAAPEEAAPEPPAEPSKGELYFYTPPGKNPRTKSPHKRVECEVVAVNKRAATVDLRSNVDKKTLYKGVAWDALEGG